MDDRANIDMTLKRSSLQSFYYTARFAVAREDLLKQIAEGFKMTSIFAYHVSYLARLHNDTLEFDQAEGTVLWTNRRFAIVIPEHVIQLARQKQFKFDRQQAKYKVPIFDLTNKYLFKRYLNNTLKVSDFLQSNTGIVTRLIYI